MLYFGVRGKTAGHYLADNTFNGYAPVLGVFENALVYKLQIDGGLCPKYTKEQGVASLTYINGLTILSFWDNSGDSRPGSNSNFIEFGRYTFEQMITIARIAFPAIFNRIPFEITQLSDDANSETSS